MCDIAINNKNINVDTVCNAFIFFFISFVEYLKAINPFELAMEAFKVIQSHFYKDFPPHPNEEVYGFATPSTMKPTQWSCKFWNIKYVTCYNHD